MKHIFASLFTLISLTASASEVEVLDVTATQTGAVWRFDVTLRHADAGWDHYADGWRILSLDGAELGTRVLVHPHVNEMPFTRSLGSVEIPQGVTRVLVVAKDNLGDWGAQNYVVNLLAE